MYTGHRGAFANEIICSIRVGIKLYLQYTYVCMYVCIYIRTSSTYGSKVIPVHVLEGPEGPRGVQVPRIFTQSAHESARLSSLCTSRLYPPWRTPGTHFYEILNLGFQYHPNAIW